MKPNETAGFDRYRAILDSLEPGTLERYDREESGAQRGAPWERDTTITYEHEQGGGAFTFAALCRSDQAAILHALDANLPTRTARPNPNTATSYGIKHAVERYTGFYVSNLQAKVALRILGYKRGGDDLNPNYNITVREWRAFSDLSRDIADKRSEARQRVARQEEQRKCARYFHKLTA